MAEPTLAGIHLVAVTLPGQGGTPALEDVRVENYARLASELAGDLGCDAVVGHSMGAAVALEMAGSGGFSGPVVLLAPSFSRRDESSFIRVVDRLARVLGHLPFSAMIKIIGLAVKDSPLPPDRRGALVADLPAIPRSLRLGGAPPMCRRSAGLGGARRNRRRRSHRPRTAHARIVSPDQHDHHSRKELLHLLMKSPHWLPSSSWKLSRPVHRRREPPPPVSVRS